MVYRGEPYDATYYKGQREEGYTDYADKSFSFWEGIANDIEVQTGPVSGKHVLELGCAFGFLVDVLAARGAVIEGLDISNEAITQAKLRFPSRSFIEKDALTSGYANNALSLIIANGLVECMPSDVEISLLFDEMKRSLKSTGKLYILTNDQGTLGNYLRKTASELDVLLAVPFTMKSRIWNVVTNLPLGYDLRCVVS